MRRIVGVVQRYAWGDARFIPELIGAEPDGGPWAELWLGTHRNGPATFEDGTPLAAECGPLPYLLKVLSAAEPLSLQTHPDAAQAIDGFARGVYADDQPKPELLCALTRFEALCGIRPIADSARLLAELGVDRSDAALALADAGPAAVIEGLLRGTIDGRPWIDACARSSRPEAVWVTRLAEQYPTDRAVAATLLLHHVVLEPGESIVLAAGQLHAYLYGSGIELMAPSDNVVRAGLTVKPVDVDELMRIADFEPVPDPRRRGAARIELPAVGVALVRLDAGSRHIATGHEVAIGLDGVAWHLAPGDEFVPGATAYVVTR